MINIKKSRMETKKKVGGKKSPVTKIEVLPDIGRVFVLCGMLQEKEKEVRRKEAKEEGTDLEHCSIKF